MRLELPSGLHYPLVVKRIDKKVGDAVKVRDQIFFYSYIGKVKEQKSRYEEEEIEVEKTLHAYFESPAEGVIERWLVWEGDTIRSPIPILDLAEECKHSIVYNGMCTECGKDVTEFHEARDTALVQAAHDTNKLLISKEEAAEVDESSKKRLLAARKLSLVVDLDQTIVHAAVDPTVGEWQKDPTNPNYEALQDVVAFQLLDDIQAQRGCWYYIKLRPGLQEFLESVAEKYELHVYTMGTRQYAEQIVKIVDPEHKFFDDRILSRDESGSMEAKSLARIFPVDTRMVVIIDDRADVWKYSPNLVRVTVFDFFAGVGDINAGFLPKKQEIPMFAEPEPEQSSTTTRNGDHKSDTEQSIPNGTAQEEDSPMTDTTALEQVVAMANAEGEDGDKAKTQEKTIAAQVEEKPLLKLQQKLDEHDKLDPSSPSEPATQGTESDSSDSDSSISGKGKRHSVLRNDDEELIHLERSLHSIHERFFNEYDRKRSSAKGGRLAALTGKRKEPVPEVDDPTPLTHIPDIKKILPTMKQRVFDGETIVFSGIIPLKVDTKSADISLWAQSFGAKIADRVGRGVTHVVANRPGSHKVNSAVSRGIPVVNLQWLIQSMQRWKKLDDRPYLLKGIGQKKSEDEPTEQIVDQDSSLLDDVLLGQQPDMLSSEEGSASNDTTDDEDGSKRKKTKLAVTVPDYAEDLDYQEVEIIPHSPITINADEWQDMDDELKDFLGSDIDSESDTESIKSELASRPKKRSREDDEYDSSADSESDSDARNGDHKRPKTTGSALKSVHNIDSNGSTPIRPEDDDGDGGDEGYGGQDSDEDEEIDPELLAAMEEVDE